MNYQLRMFHPQYGELTTPQDLFIHIPFKVLTECVIVSGVKEPMMTLAEYAKEKSKVVSQ